MNLGISLNSPCYRSPYPPTNPISGRSPRHRETVIWSARTQTAKLVTSLPQRRDDYVPSTQSSTLRTYTETRTGIDVLRLAKQPMTASRNTAATNNSQCGPTIATQCPPQGKIWGNMARGS